MRFFGIVEIMYHLEEKWTFVWEHNTSCKLEIYSVDIAFKPCTGDVIGGKA